MVQSIIKNREDGGETVLISEENQKKGFCAFSIKTGAAVDPGPERWSIRDWNPQLQHRSTAPRSSLRVETEAAASAGSSPTFTQQRIHAAHLLEDVGGGHETEADGLHDGVRVPPAPPVVSQPRLNRFVQLDFWEAAQSVTVQVRLQVQGEEQQVNDK